MDNLYATVIHNLLSRGESEEKVMKNLKAHLTMRGRAKLLPGILRSLKVLMVRHKAQSGVVEGAHKDEAGAALKEAAALGIQTEEAVVNPILLSGWRGRAQGTLVDRSGKRALTDIYRKIVKA